jgi:hypothetical protein
MEIWLVREKIIESIEANERFSVVYELNHEIFFTDEDGRL